MEKVLEAVKAYWNLLPKEIKVAWFYAGALVLNMLAENLLNLEPIEWNTLIRLFIGNTILVFLKELGPRIEILKG